MIDIGPCKLVYVDSTTSYTKTDMVVDKGWF